MLLPDSEMSLQQSSAICYLQLATATDIDAVGYPLLLQPQESGKQSILWHGSCIMVNHEEFIYFVSAMNHRTEICFLLPHTLVPVLTVSD